MSDLTEAERTVLQRAVEMIVNSSLSGAARGSNGGSGASSVTHRGGGRSGTARSSGHNDARTSSGRRTQTRIHVDSGGVAKYNGPPLSRSHSHSRGKYPLIPSKAA